MNEQQLLALISQLVTTIPNMVLLYKTITANREGTRTIEELLADADTQYDAVIAKAKQELGQQGQG